MMKQVVITLFILLAVRSQSEPSNTLEVISTTDKVSEEAARPGNYVLPLSLDQEHVEINIDLAEFFGSNLTEQRAEMTYRRALTQKSKHLVLKIIDELNF